MRIVKNYGVIFIATLALLSSLSWGACVQELFSNDSWCTGVIYSCDYSYTCTSTPPTNYGCYGGRILSSTCFSSNASSCDDKGYTCGRYGNNYFIRSYVLGICCDTQAEADSIYCAQNPSDPSCVVETDTTLFGCSDNASGNGALYRLSCKATNGVVTSCNGKTDVNIATDGTLVRPLQGTCAQNGFGSGIIGGASSDSTETPPSANSECFAIIGSTCHMRDKASGNTFRCECDGSCNVALRNLMAGNADCSNPYEQPEQQDSVTFPLSSPSSSASSSGSQGGGSSGGEGGSSGEMYDPWSPLLEDIKANTQYNNELTQQGNEWLEQIQNNTYTANGLLQAIANKDWTPTINVGSPNVNVAGDTNIINIELTGDTARAPSEILGYLRDTSGIGGYADQFATEKATALAWADSVHANAVAFADSISGVEVPDMSDSLGNAVQGISGALRTLKDTIDNSAMSDSMGRWQGLITDNGVISGEGTNDCPDILTQTYSWGFTIAGTTINVPVGSLGTYICSPISPFGVTIWAFCRVIIRAIVAIGCMFWIYKAVLGIDQSGEDD